MAAPDARTLATHLASLDDAALTELLTVRRIPATAAWDDFFDAADALLDPVSIARGVAALPRDDAAALLDAVTASAAGREASVPAGPRREVLTRRALVAPDGVPYGAVVAGWASLPTADTTPPATPAGEDEAHAAERAFAAATSLADILHAALATPLSRIGSGALGATERRRLIEDGAVDSPDAADDLVEIAATAGLLSDVDRHWIVTTDGDRWLGERTVTRWHHVALRLRAALPTAVVSADGWLEVSEWRSAYPFDPAWPARADRWRALLQRWAVIGPDGRSAAWAEGVRDGAGGDESALQALLPAEVDRVFLQNDLTAIAPGPLEPQLDRRLRTMALRETRAQASTYRFTAETLSAALTTGETADSVRRFLADLSLTGVPQPLEYEIDRSARRHGSIRVGPDWSGRTQVTALDPAMLPALAVDQALRPLGLTPHGDVLLSRSSPDTVFWMLADARYPVVAVDADGAVRTLDRRRLAPTPPDATASPDAYAPLRERLRAAHAADADSAWLGRELEQAVRARAVLTIVVRMPDGGEREITMEATGLGGGRLRGRDRVADVERTLPVSSIASVRPA
ncbi:MAG: helicase-associated domain-containing protein [Candidatus Microbacterium phytovorans]|uniref:Helicase-associated domain-containing protein n=1 Tax=Candidatus Microbacterium phytovorans TaxID=3121374 RepID=A0AAJ6B598_9MICO|nr:helicase-associated domain-containing protein [Microbacterium sp.]WEK14944.1 MAG: helicase-associated domain-containing protein [Microbacterium sp.]